VDKPSHDRRHQFVQQFIHTLSSGFLALKLVVKPHADSGRRLVNRMLDCNYYYQDK